MRKVFYFYSHGIKNTHKKEKQYVKESKVRQLG